MLSETAFARPFFEEYRDLHLEHHSTGFKVPRDLKIPRERELDHHCLCLRDVGLSRTVSANQSPNVHAQPCPPVPSTVLSHVFTLSCRTASSTSTTPSASWNPRNCPERQHPVRAPPRSHRVVRSERLRPALFGMDAQELVER